jgi:hypothetical protein
VSRNPANHGTCPEIVKGGPRIGEVCGKIARSSGYCGMHGPAGVNATRAARAREQRGECEQILAHGKRPGEVCGQPAEPGKTVCRRHDPSSGWGNCGTAAEGNQCKARSSQTGKQCANGALPGLDVCHKHGGRVPAAKAKSAEFVRQQKARESLARLGVDLSTVINPYLALQAHCAQLVAWRDYCLARVMELKETAHRYKSDQGLEQVRGEIQMYQNAAREATTALSALARQNTDEHLMAIKAGTYLMLTGALRDTLAEAGLDAGQIAAIKAGFARRVRVFHGDGIIDGSAMAELENGHVT